MTSSWCWPTSDNYFFFHFMKRKKFHDIIPWHYDNYWIPHKRLCYCSTVHKVHCTKVNFFSSCYRLLRVYLMKTKIELYFQPFLESAEFAALFISNLFSAVDQKIDVIWKFSICYQIVSTLFSYVDSCQLKDWQKNRILVRSLLHWCSCFSSCSPVKCLVCLS